MNNRHTTPKLDNPSFIGVIRGFAEASVVALAFVLAVLAIGTPFALLARGVHEGLSWLARLSGETSALMEALVSVASVLGTILVVAVLVRVLARFFQWRRRFRARASGTRPAHAWLNSREIVEAA